MVGPVIWWVGFYSELCHFGCAFALAWVVLRLTSGIFSTSLRKDKLTGVMVITLAFGLGGLFHLWLDSWQPYI
jgi:hypothetical protein